MLRNYLEEDVCLYRPNEQWRGEFEWLMTLHDHSWRIAEHSKKSAHVVREGFKKNDPRSSKNNLQHIQLSDTTGTTNGTGFYGQI